MENICSACMKFMILPGARFFSASVPMAKSGRVDEHHQRNVEAVAQHQEAGDLLAGIRIERPALDERVVGDDADRMPADARQRRDRHLAEASLQLEQAILVDDLAHDAAHVVDLRALGRQQPDDVAHTLARARAAPGARAAPRWHATADRRERCGSPPVPPRRCRRRDRQSPSSPRARASRRAPAGSTCSPIASEASSELDTASTAPLRITQKSESTAYQLDEPIGEAERGRRPGRLAHGARIASDRCPSRLPMPREPMWSGMRAPEDSPRKTSGSPRDVATRFMCAILRPLVDDEDAPITVKSLETTATSRSSMRPKPAILPSAGRAVAILGARARRAKQSRLDEACPDRAACRAARARRARPLRPAPR